MKSCKVAFTSTPTSRTHHWELGKRPPRDRCLSRDPDPFKPLPRHGLRVPAQRRHGRALLQPDGHLNFLVQNNFGASLGGPSSTPERPSSSSTTKAATTEHEVDIGAHLLIDLATLRTLAGQPAFPAIVNTFSLYLRASQWKEAIDELNAHQRARDARASHDALWANVSRLIGQNKIRYVPIPATGDAPAASEGNEDVMLQLDAVALAHGLGKPLLADDRVLQVLMFQGDSGSTCRAFDTSKVLLAMAKAGVLTRSEAAGDIHRLIKWRYRFIVPSSDILLHTALECIDNLPGDALIDIAAYLHDCLRDPGLHYGPEPFEPPLPMAARLVTAWSEMIASLLARIWSDAQFSDEIAARLTQWIGEELVPSCPTGMSNHPMGLNIVQAEIQSLLGMAEVQCAAVPDARRANLCLRILADTFGMDEDMFLTTTVEAIHVIART